MSVTHNKIKIFILQVTSFGLGFQFLILNLYSFFAHTHIYISSLYQTTLYMFIHICTVF